MLAQLINRPCTITRRLESPDHDAYGDEIPEEVAIETVCELQKQERRGGEESSEEVSDSQWKLFLPAETPLGSGDTVTVEGVVYEIEGDPWQARNPRTQQFSHIEVAARLTAGPDLPGGGS